MIARIPFTFYAIDMFIQRNETQNVTLPMSISPIDQSIAGGFPLGYLGERVEFTFCVAGMPETSYQDSSTLWRTEEPFPKLAIGSGSEIVAHWGSVAVVRKRNSINGDFLIRPTLDEFSANCAPNTLVSVSGAPEIWPVARGLLGFSSHDDLVEDVTVMVFETPYNLPLMIPLKVARRIVAMLGDITRSRNHRANIEDEEFRNCDRNSVAQLPNIQLHFGEGGLFNITPSTYIGVNERDRTCSLSFAVSGSPNHVSINPLQIPNTNLMVTQNSFHLCETNLE